MSVINEVAVRAERKTGNGCGCQLCKRHRHVNEVIERRDPDEMVKTIRDLTDGLLHAEADHEYAQAVLDGKWPGSVEILEEAIVKAREIAAKRTR